MKRKKPSNIKTKPPMPAAEFGLKSLIGGAGV